MCADTNLVSRCSVFVLFFIKDVSTAAKDVMSLLLMPNIDQRSENIKQVRNAQWFSTIKWESMEIMAVPSPLGDADSLRPREDEHELVPEWMCTREVIADADWMRLY